MGGCHSEINKNKKKTNKISKQSNTKISMLILNKSDLITNDPEQDSHFFLVEDVWYKDHERPELLFDPKKFIKFYKDYRQLQIHYAQNWENLTIEKPEEDIQENETLIIAKQSFDSQGKKAALNEWRYVIRKGVPLSLIRDLIQCVFNMNPKIISKEYEEIKAFDQYFKLQYNPLVVNTTALLFLFLNEDETHYCIKSMLENSIEQLNRHQTQAMKLLRWHFTLTQEDSNKNAKLFIDHCSRRSSDFRNLVAHFEKCGFLKQYMQIFIDESNKIFMDIFKYSTCIRIFTIFLNEGVRVFYKIFYGYTMILRPRLLLSQDPAILKDLILLSHIDEEISQLEKLFKMAYTLKIKNNNKDFQQIRISNLVSQPALNVYYRPRVKDQSEIINYNSVFGAFLDTMINIDNKKSFYGGNESFVFQLAPNQEVYMTNTDTKEGEDINKNHILSTTDYLQIGINDPAITLKDDLSGYTQKCETYLSPPLNNSNTDTFSTSILELYYLKF
ncbi:hypothetical protein PPERSA_05333 [Pseudocohnilembus persalinus]|uniref:TLDc domain-containing protein n=1 Tax=Pseudocohnilembus persalinus TaxID=266149 RepID=A0A0V0R6U0_PSEPJ|nr:hypothetical protein PPERSA_05333 [Pseudocohnilembus persalinus]|eukprot:KRX09941.1 hypothetical protein PPERSA_05333 [Pseudocohnilembus persalinus]